MTHAITLSPRADNEDDWLAVGTIVAPQGLRGELRVYPDSDFPERFKQPGQRWLQRAPDSAPQPVELLGGRWLAGKGLYIIRLAGVGDRQAAEALRGSKLLVKASDRPHLEPDEYHVADLVGLTVVLQATGAAIGRVADVLSAGNDLLAVQLDAAPQAEPALIPFVKAIVPVVDLAAGRLEIVPPVGLLELNQAEPLLDKPNSNTPNRAWLSGIRSSASAESAER